MNIKYKYFLLNIILFIICSSYSKNSFSNNNLFNYQRTTSDQIKKLNCISNAHSQCLTQFQKQLSDIEHDINCLRDQIQNNEHQLNNIIEQQNNILKKINIFLIKNSNKVSQTEGDISSSSANTYYNSTIQDNATNNDFIDYNKSVNLVLEKKQYAEAIQAFQNFLLKYPNSIYQANAHYWLGQLYYQKGNKKNASYHFSLVAKYYPKSSKASDALLKVGIIMQENGYKEQAKLIYKEIFKLYPNSDAAKKVHKRLINL